jgi:hypothetical protein
LKLYEPWWAYSSHATWLLSKKGWFSSKVKKQPYRKKVLSNSAENKAIFQKSCIFDTLLYKDQWQIR